MTETADPGLRERKKAQTRQQIAQAAYDVVREHGIEALSADAVSQRAGVSRRTFFNYFTTVESSLQPVIHAFLDDIDQRLRHSTVQGPLMPALAALVMDEGNAELLERITVLGVAAHDSAAHRGLFAEASHAWIDDFSAQLGEMAEATPDELYVTGAATALVGAAEASLRVWIRRTGGEITPETVELRRQLLAEAINRLGTGFNTL
jgi:AcrR family transcriptional regulator